MAVKSKKARSLKLLGQMNKKTRFYAFLFLSLLLSAKSFAQFELSVPAITKQEFFNPAFNSYKKHVSLNLMSRQQWYNAGIAGPRVLALNGFFPIGNTSIGVGGNAISEEVGLRTVNTACLNVSKGVQIATDSHLSVGLGIGVQSETYSRNKMTHYPEVNFKGVKLSQVNPAFSLGLMTMISNLFFGASSNLTISKHDFDYKYLVGFDGIAGTVKVVSTDLVYRISIVGKYYIQNKFEANADGTLNNGYVDPIVDLSFHCFLYEKIWLGTSHRFKEAQTLTISARFGKRKNLTLGYLYEKGIGSGLNQFDTQGVFLAYNFFKGRGSGKRAYFQKRRIRYVKSLSEYLY